jgi:RND family efflux transporter MFP subunit
MNNEPPINAKDQTSEDMNTSAINPTANASRGTRKGSTYAYVAVPAVLFVLLVAFGAGPRFARLNELNRVHAELKSAIPSVSAIVVQPADNQQTLLLPGDLQPIQNIPIYARANGFIHERFVDIGDIVKAGQLLITIETPELDQQLEQAKANVRVAEANLTTALSDRQNFAAQLFATRETIKQSRTNLEYSNTQYKRYQLLATDGAVSYEQRDQWLKQWNSDEAALNIAQENEKSMLAQVVSADARIASAKQSVESSEANVRQILALQGFQKVYAPCDGVITDRFVDAGALVAAGGSQGTTELLAMQRTDILRIYVDVPQTDYRYIHTGDKADLLLQEFPGQAFSGTVSNIAGSLNSNSRTLQTELRIDNKDHVLRPGSYADVKFVFNRPDPPVVVPSNAAVTKNDGLYAAVVVNDQIKYHPIEVSRDFGNRLEVKIGIKANDVVLLDPPGSLVDGDKVKPNISQHKPAAAKN